MFNYRIYLVTLMSCMGAVLFGYDTGFIGGTIGIPAFQRDFGITPDTLADIKGNIVATLNAGCFFGAVFMAYFASTLGRKWGMVISSVVFIIGAILQLVTTSSIGLLYGGRIVSGLGIGASSMLVPTYLSEMSPANMRGKLVTCYGFFIFFAIAISYWVDYGCERGLSEHGHNQWRIPMAIQVIPGALLFAGGLFVKESPRWLIRKGKKELALKNLLYIRMVPYSDYERMANLHNINNINPIKTSNSISSNQKNIEPTVSSASYNDDINTINKSTTFEPNSISPADQRALDLIKEYNEMVVTIEADEAAKGKYPFMELFAKNFYKRTLIGFTLQVCQQFTGTNTFTYYAPTLFQTVGLRGTSTGLFATGIYGIVKMVFSMLFILFLANRAGRRLPFLAGALFQGIWMLLCGVLLSVFPPDPNSDSPSSPSLAMIVFIYFFCITYSMSWGPLPFTYIAEMYPNRVREYAVALGLATQWAVNYGISKFVPIAIQNIGWKTFIIFAITNFTIFFFSFFCLRETAGVPLEQMDALFGTAFFMRPSEWAKGLWPPCGLDRKDQQDLYNAEIAARENKETGAYYNPHFGTTTTGFNQNDVEIGGTRISPYQSRVSAIEEFEKPDASHMEKRY